MKIVDELGKIKAKIADLEKEEKRLKDKLNSMGAGEYEGDLFKCVVSEYTKTTTDYKTFIRKIILTPSQKGLLTKLTSKTLCSRVTVYSK